MTAAQLRDLVATDAVVLPSMRATDPVHMAVSLDRITESGVAATPGWRARR
ncbi:hypothetical protein [Streptomyces sp. Ru72]|uniref:hypothetical protein n=1 Tax=Streptomyces sp. Ru72 TaxID=2080747 RepID=UPI0015E2D528|nr:hypothetical protein [Streptomyces sp. Ru72]